jgi:hypothetical protein
VRWGMPHAGHTRWKNLSLVRRSPPDIYGPDIEGEDAVTDSFRDSGTARRASCSISKCHRAASRMRVLTLRFASVGPRLR